MKIIAGIILFISFSFLSLQAQNGGQTAVPSPTPASGEILTVSPAKTSTADESLKKAFENSTAKPEFSNYAVKNAPVRIPRFETPPSIDGQIDEAVWQNAAVFGDFLQITPGDNVAPVAPTEVMMGYDAKNLYLAFRMKQEKDKIRATVARRDDIFNDDYFGVYLDTFNDQKQAYVLFFNPLGVQADGIYTEGRGEDYSVDIVMTSKGVLTADGYTVEVAIPFKSLRYEAGKDKQWGIQIYRRVKYNNNELDSWMRNSRSNSSSLSQAGHLTGLEDVATTRQLEINPSFTVSQSGSRTRTIPVADLIANPALQDHGRYVNGGLKADFGFTAKFGLTPTTTLDFAYNPDFAQVEADAPVVTANQRFPIFFEEKRPFFLERIDIFQTRMNIVNTRTIVDPDLALKLTGRSGKNTYGVLYASDKYPGYTRFTDDERTDPTLRNNIEKYLGKNADIGILRYKRDVGKQNNIGFFSTTYNFVERHNNTAGFDGRFRLNPKSTFEFQVVGTNSRRYFYDSETDRSDYRTGNGFGYSYQIERSDRNLYMNLRGVGRTRNYRADVGFTPRTDTNQHSSFVQYVTERDPKKNIIFKRVNNSSAISFDWRGRLQNWSSNVQGMVALQRQTFVGAGAQFGYERVFEEEFGAKRTAARQGAFFGNDSERSAKNQDYYTFIETNPVKQFYANIVVDYTIGQLDYDFGASEKYPRASRAALLDPNNALDPGAGNQLTFDLTTRYQPTNALQIQLNYTKTKLVRQDTNLTAFNDNIYSLRSTYQFTRNTFARVRFDYSTLNTHFRPQLVAGWTPNPGTALYIGYNDDISYNGYNQYTGQFEPGLRGNGRTFFIKASYLLKKSF